MKAAALLISLALFAFGMQAQDLTVPTSKDVKNAEQNVKTEAAKVTDQANIGSLIGQLTNGISDNAFTDSFRKNKSDFVNKVNKVSDAAGASSALQSLQGGMVPAAMDAGWGKVRDKWIKDTKTAKTVKDVAGVAGTLESNISGKYFKGNWATARPAWQAALSALAK